MAFSRRYLDTMSFHVVSHREDDNLLLERQLCFALALASRTVISAYRPVFQSLDLTRPQYIVMLALWKRSPRSVKDISAQLLLGPATLSPLLKRLGIARNTVAKALLQPLPGRASIANNGGDFVNGQLGDCRSTAWCCVGCSGHDLLHIEREGFIGGALVHVPSCDDAGADH